MEITLIPFRTQLPAQAQCHNIVLSHVWVNLSYHTIPGKYSSKFAFPPRLWMYYEILNYCWVEQLSRFRKMQYVITYSDGNDIDNKIANSVCGCEQKLLRRKAKKFRICYRLRKIFFEIKPMKYWFLEPVSRFLCAAVEIKFSV